MSNKPSNKHYQGGHPKKEAGTHNRSPEELAAINETFVAFSEKYEETNKKNPSRDGWKFRIEVATAVGVGVYTLITAGLLIAGLYQLKASADQIEIMRDTEHRQLRAYVGMNPGDVEDFGVSGKQKIRFIRKNFGSTPAYDVGFSKLGFSIIKIGDPIDFGMTGCVGPGIPGQITMFPTTELPWIITLGDTKNVTQQSADRLVGLFTNAELQLVKSGDRQFVYWGTACYRDAFNKPHFTNYCWMYKGASMTARDAEACLTHNDSD
jgi:hypothetical protein